MKNNKKNEIRFGFEREKRKRQIKNLSWGVAKNFTNLVFLQLVFFGSLAVRGKYASRELRKIFEKYEGIDWDKLRKTLGDLKRKGFIDYAKGQMFEPEITKAGIKRYKSLFPVYDRERTWDKKVYLITYDIPEAKRINRDKLRDFLQKIGCGKLQDSVWLTCYNPKKLVKGFVEHFDIEGSVIVSDIGKDGNIGEEDLQGLVKQVYKLDELNEKYQDFIFKIKDKKISPHQIGFVYNSILLDDPQVPFELLPDDWMGEKAYKIFLHFCHFKTTAVV